MANKAINIREYFNSTDILRPVPYYPVNSILIFADNAFDPNTLYAGTWVRFSESRLLVAFSTNQASYFKSLGTDVGSLYMQSHNHYNASNHSHTIPSHNHRTGVVLTGSEAAGYGLSSSMSFLNRVRINGGNTSTLAPTSLVTTSEYQVGGSVAGGFTSEYSGSGLEEDSNIMECTVVAFWVRIE